MVDDRCDFCGKMYTASGSLRLHLKSHLSRLGKNPALFKGFSQNEFWKSFGCSFFILEKNKKKEGTSTGTGS
jgi:hypothetical protein